MSGTVGILDGEDDMCRHTRQGLQGVGVQVFSLEAECPKFRNMSKTAKTKSHRPASTKPSTKG